MSQANTARVRPDPMNQAVRLLSYAKQAAASWTAALLSDTIGVRQSGNNFGILMYHRISKPVDGLPSPTWNVSPNRFRAQLSGLLRRGFQAWPLRKVLAFQKQCKALPKRVFVVTFDDGYENFYTQAFPILRDLRIPATVFLATSFLNSNEPLPFDDWSAKGHLGVSVDSWRAMNDDQCRELLASGLIELGAHTHTHQDFRNRPEDLTADLHECLAYLKTRFGLSDATFAFPYGTKRLGFSGGRLTEAAKRSGVLCSLTTEPALASTSSSPFDWGRITAEERDNAATLAGKITGWYSVLRESLKRFGRVLKREDARPAYKPEG